ncbi:uncharacterized protein TNCV_808521 [Trichonephila clavipes]|nr:uncharacterized protein TNCV_808521 [Trichonephila clavipes]
MQDGATSHTTNPVKAFLIQTFGEDRIVSRCSRYPWPTRSPDLTPTDFWLWGYLEISRVSIRSIKSVGTERCDPQRIPHIRTCCTLRSWICHSSRMSSPCGGGHVEHILVS